MQNTHLSVSEKIDRICLIASSEEELLTNVLDGILEEFQCDRAWFLSPSKSAANSYHVAMERTRPEWLGAFVVGTEIPANPDTEELYKQAIEFKKAIVSDAESDHAIPDWAVERFSIQAQMAVAVFPKFGQPWLLGIHHCVRAHVFSEEEQRSFSEIAQRITDSLSSFITLQELRDNESYNRMLFEKSPVGLALCRMNGELVDVNPAYGAILGRAVEETLSLTYWDITPKKYAEDEARQLKSLENTGQYGPYEKEYIHKSGHLVPVRLSGSLLEKGGEKYIWSCVEDITEYKQGQVNLSESQKMLQLVLDSIPVRVFWKDTESVYLGCNKLFAMDAGLESPKQIVGKTDFDLAWMEQAELYRLDDRNVIQAGKPKLNYEEPQTSPEGESLWLRTSKIPLTDLPGTVIGVMGTYEDITSIKQSQEKMDFLAYHDPLTHLPNRLLLSDRLEHSLQRAEREGTQVAVLFIDLDNFKNINDSLGHPTGDVLLQEVAKRIKSLVRVDDTVARLGGDEFIVVMEEIGEAQDSTLLAKKLVGAFNQPFTAKGRELYLTLSIGISIYPGDGADSETLIRNADSAMYRAKAEGRNDYQFYTSALTTAAFERLTLENALRRALENDEFILHYQPQYSLDTGKLTGLEALIRWQHPDMGVIAPDKFIPLAEESGIIVAIGEWVLRTACSQMKNFLDSGYSIQRMSINISGVQFQRGSIVDNIMRVLKETNLDPKSLELEITESIVMQETGKTVKILNEIRQQGITIAIDDFGTGYSSLSYLKRLPVNKLKVDRSFVRDIPQDSNDQAITRAVIALGQALNLEVTAEGVETEEQQIFLKSLGCNEAQGNLYSRPLPVEQLVEILKKDK